MLLFFELKKLISIKALAVLMLVCLTLIALFAVREAGSARECIIDAEEAAGVYCEFVSETKAAAASALSAAKRSGDGDYTEAYCAAIIEAYETAEACVVFKSGGISGWDELLRFDLPFFICLFISVVIGAAAFFEDSRIGMDIILLSTKRGRVPSSALRLLSSALLSALFCTAAAGVSFLCFRLNGLLLNGSFALQSAPSFCQSEKLLSLQGAFLLLSARRALICVLLAVSACLIGKLLRGYIPIILVSAILPVLEFTLFCIRYNAVDVFVKNVNIFAYAGAYSFGRLYLVRSRLPLDPERITFISVSALIPAAGSLAAALPDAKRTANAKILPIRFELKLPRIKARPHALFTWEFIKLLRTPALLLPLIVCVAAGIGGIYRRLPVKLSASEQLYRSSCAEYSQLSIAEVQQRLSDEELRIQLALSKIDDADSLFAAGRIDEAEYEAIMDEYLDCLVYEGRLPRLMSRFDYLSNTSLEYGHDMRFIYDTGYNKLINSDVSFFLVLAVILIGCAPFLGERENSLTPMIRALKNGRKKLFRIRLCFVSACSMLLFALFSAAELHALSDVFRDADAPAASLELLHDFGLMPLSGFIVQMYLLRFLMTMCSAAAVFALSASFERSFLAPAPVGIWALVSLALRKLGLSLPALDLSALLSGNAALTASGEWAWLIALPFVLFTFSALCFSYRRYTV